MFSPWVGALVAAAVAEVVGRASGIALESNGTHAGLSEWPWSRKAQLTVYYETLCPYCERLFDISFRKIWEDAEFRERLDLELVPFGNAKVISRRNLAEGYQFWHPDAPDPTVVCQHWEPECLGNEIQSCAIDLFGTTDAAGLVVCMAGKHSRGHGIEMSAYDCLQELGIDPAKVKQCLGSRRSTRLTLTHGKWSTRRSLKRKYVPWVMINGRHAELDDEHDLVRPLCAVLREPKPALCNQDTSNTGAVVLAARRGPPLQPAQGLRSRSPSATAS